MATLMTMFNIKFLPGKSKWEFAAEKKTTATTIKYSNMRMRRENSLMLARTSFQSICRGVGQNVSPLAGSKP